MKKDNFKTKVVFRKFKDGEIIALFPFETQNYKNDCLSYMHLGQHSEASYFYCIQISKPATEKEYKDLFNELSEIGYNLQIIKRFIKK